MGSETFADPGFAIVIALARRVQDAGGRALIVGGWVRDRLMGRVVERHRSRGLRPLRAGTTGGAGGIRHGQHCRRELYRLQGCRHRRRAARGANRRRGAATAASRSRAIRICRLPKRPGGATSPSTRSPGIRSPDEYLDPCERTRRSGGPGSSRGGSRRPSATTRSGCCARCSLPRASTSTSSPDTRDICRRLELDDLPAERIWGEFEKLLLQAPRPSVGLQLALELGVVAPTVSRARGARRMRAGTRVAPRR